MESFSFQSVIPSLLCPRFSRHLESILTLLLNLSLPPTKNTPEHAFISRPKQKIPRKNPRFRQNFIFICTCICPIFCPICKISRSCSNTRDQYSIKVQEEHLEHIKLVTYQIKTKTDLSRKCSGLFLYSIIFIYFYCCFCVIVCENITLLKFAVQIRL